MRLLPVTLVLLGGVLSWKSAHMGGVLFQRLAAQEVTPQPQTQTPSKEAPSQNTSTQNTSTQNTSPKDIADKKKNKELPPESLSQRHSFLDKREKELADREALLKAAENRLAAREKRLEALKKELESILHKKRADKTRNVEQLVSIYANMKPKEAASIFDKMDTATLMDVVRGMKPRQAAPIIGAMNPERARRVTQALAGTPSARPPLSPPVEQ